jgi:hypothetical protein
MGSFFEEAVERIARLLRHAGFRHRHGIETERLGGRDERRLCLGRCQKSRSA